MQNSLSDLFTELNSSVKFENSFSMYPSSMVGIGAEKRSFANATSTYFGFVVEGGFELKYKSQNFKDLGKGFFFSCPGEVELAGKGRAIVIERFGYRGLFNLGLLEEESGRLCYIDNASTTILIPPPRRGDPVFNFLAFPPNVIQSPHIHPTIRLGLVIGGSGECVTPENNKIALKVGTAFCLPERFAHSFNSGKDGLQVIAFHPDSDVGPTDESHPMLSRTYLLP